MLSHALSLLGYVKCPDYLTNVVSLVDCGRPRRGLRPSSSSDFSLPRLCIKFGKRALRTPARLRELTAKALNMLRAVTEPGRFRL